MIRITVIFRPWIFGIRSDIRYSDPIHTFYLFTSWIPGYLPLIFAFSHSLKLLGVIQSVQAKFRQVLEFLQDLQLLSNKDGFHLNSWFSAWSIENRSECRSTSCCYSSPSEQTDPLVVFIQIPLFLRRAFSLCGTFQRKVGAPHYSLRAVRSTVK